jgi:hypothetical protein
MNEIIIISRHALLERLDEYFENMPLHVFIIDLVPTGESTVFCMYPESEYMIEHTYATFLDNIKPPKAKEGEQVITKEVAEEIQDFIFKIRNKTLTSRKRLIVTCKNGRSVSGAVALWAMDWLMDGDEAAFNKLNPDILPNELILKDLYLHPLI